MAITFPIEPELGQEYVAENSATYQWTGSAWSTVLPWINNRTEFIIDGGVADQIYNDNIDYTLEGGGA